MLSGVDQIISSSNSFLNSIDRGAHLMKFGLAPTIDAIFIFTTTDSHRFSQETFLLFLLAQAKFSFVKRKSVTTDYTDSTDLFFMDLLLLFYFGMISNPKFTLSK